MTKDRNFPGIAPTNRRPCLRCPALLGPAKPPWPAWLDTAAETFDDLLYCYGGSVLHTPAVFR